MNIPENCRECQYANTCNAPHYGGSRCVYVLEIIEKTLSVKE